MSLTCIVVVLWLTTSSLIPPNKEKMEKCFQQDRDKLIVIVDYLSSLDYPFVSIDKSDIENGVMFAGAKLRYQIIDDEIALNSLKEIMNNRNYLIVGKSNNTIFFQKWSFLEKDRGIAVPINKNYLPDVEFLIKAEPLSELGWYYYEADYEEYRN